MELAKVFGKLRSGFFGNKNTRKIKNLRPVVARVNALEERVRSLQDEDFPKQTASLRKRFADGETLDALLPEAFAMVREAGQRTLNQRHYDVQLMGAMVLHQGHIAEMRTGEGKTLVATLAAYLNALVGAGVHLVTVNDYLAERDANWMRPLYQLLGLSVGVVISGQSQADKRLAYNADMTYGTNNEFGFDYLRDNMAFSTEDRVQRSHNYAIVDEVDSILIDEARTPLIISGPSEDNAELYQTVNTLVQGLDRHLEGDKQVLAIDQSYLSEEEIEAQGHYVLDEKNRAIELTEKGHKVIEQRLVSVGLITADDNLYATGHLGLLHHVQAALKAQTMFRKDVDYLVRNGEVMIIDEHTGRVMAGRRWADGIHQAVEAKEGVAIQHETQTLAATTFQNYFRLYDKLSGMTGTAVTEAFELKQIYGLEVVAVPTNKVMVRADMDDLIYMTVDEKYEAIIEDVRHCVGQGQPVLVGTASVESSERLSNALAKESVQHRVLNAKRHHQEASIIAQAGKAGVVTIATNMAGRGTDIILGGNWEVELDDEVSEQERALAQAEWQQEHGSVIAAGGLHIIGTERHESRRIDNQLRGRSGRQGDPGSSRFYLSMDDDLMRIFASDRIRGIMQSLGLERGEVIEHRMVTGAIERAQRKVEGRNFDIRKNLLEYDDVANDQRQMVYAQRRELMAEDGIADTIVGMREEVVQDLVDTYIPPQSLYEQWNVDGLTGALQAEFDSCQPVAAWLEADAGMAEEALRLRILEQMVGEYQEKERLIGTERARALEKAVMLVALDQLWKEHLAAMDHMREGIALRAYAQKQPKQEYKRESFELFQELFYNIRYRVIRDLSKVQVDQDTEAEIREKREKQAALMQAHQADPSTQPALDDAASAALSPGKMRQTPFVRTGQKIGRNAPCPCGSGSKYKHCHGKAG